MKVKLLENGEIKDVESGYAARLIEQGKAVAVKPAAPAKKDKK